MNTIYRLDLHTYNLKVNRVCESPKTSGGLANFSATIYQPEIQPQGPALLNTSRSMMRTLCTCYYYPLAIPWKNGCLCLGHEGIWDPYQKNWVK